MQIALPKPLATHLVAELRRLRRRYHKRLERCQGRFSETAVHDLRIETRRLLAMLDLLRALHFDAAVRKPRKALKRRLDAFDALRDTHVCIALLKPLRRALPELRVLDSRWRRHERELIARLRRRINTTKQARLQKRLKQIEATLRDTAVSASRQSGRTLALRALGEAYARVLALRQRIRPHRPATIHRTRIAFKRLRYLSELLQPMLPGLTREHLKRMRDFQALMGTIQDLEVLLGAVAAAAKAGQLPTADTRRLRATLLLGRRDATDRFLATLDELSTFDPARLAQLRTPATISTS